MNDQGRATGSGSPRGMREAESRRGHAATRLWNDVVEDSARDERSRVVPLPLALAAVLLPFLAAWASAGPAPGPMTGEPAAGAASARTLPEALRLLGRGDRAPEAAGGYVDVWGPLEPWEAETLLRRGHVEPGR